MPVLLLSNTLQHSCFAIKIEKIYHKYKNRIQLITKYVEIEKKNKKKFFSEVRFGIKKLHQGSPDFTRYQIVSKRYSKRKSTLTIDIENQVHKNLVAFGTIVINCR